MTEPRLTPDQLVEKIVEYHTTRPLVVSEAQYKNHIQDTIGSRHRASEELISKVQDLLNRLASDQNINSQTKSEIRLAVEQLDTASSKMAYGSLGYNKAANGKPHTIAWPSRNE